VNGSSDAGIKSRVKYWEIIADNLRKPVGRGAAPEGSIATSEQSGLLKHIATMEKSLVVRADEKLTAFVELESAVREPRGE
jgi:hypothetical protein